MRLTDLETPALVPDRVELEANVERTRAHLASDIALSVLATVTGHQPETLATWSRFNGW